MLCSRAPILYIRDMGKAPSPLSKGRLTMMNAVDRAYDVTNADLDANFSLQVQSITVLIMGALALIAIL